MLNTVPAGSDPGKTERVRHVRPEQILALTCHEPTTPGEWRYLIYQYARLLIFGDLRRDRVPPPTSQSGREYNTSIRVENNKLRLDHDGSCHFVQGTRQPANRPPLDDQAILICDTYENRVSTGLPCRGRWTPTHFHTTATSVGLTACKRCHEDRKIFVLWFERESVV